jgi:thymidylate synthase (FAD)
MKIEVLDHGYVELIECWGTGKDGVDFQFEPEVVHDYEIGIVEAARQSTQGSFRGWKEDAPLLRRLYKNNHATPFEFAGMVIEVQAPIMVFREWHRHRTESYNEMSARYAPLPDLYYAPARDDVLLRGERAEVTRNRQEAGTAPFDPEYVDRWLAQVEHAYRQLEEIYQNALAHGIPKELARITMPVGHYSRMRASANLRNWLAFLTLRMSSNAQKEIRLYATAVYKIMLQQFPQVMSLFYDAWVGVPDSV